jgi:hypothetical protein
MMRVLAVRTSPERVYHRALAYVTPDELAEAFAATRRVASPTQLRESLKRDPREPARRVPGAGAAVLAVDLAATVFRTPRQLWVRPRPAAPAMP